MTQVSEEIEGRVTKKLFKEFTRILVREVSRNAYGENQGTNEEQYQNDPHPEARVSQRQYIQDFGPGDAYDNTLVFKVLTADKREFLFQKTSRNFA